MIINTCFNFVLASVFIMSVLTVRRIVNCCFCICDCVKCIFTRTRSCYTCVKKEFTTDQPLLNEDYPRYDRINNIDATDDIDEK